LEEGNLAEVVEELLKLGAADLVLFAADQTLEGQGVGLVEGLVGGDGDVARVGAAAGRTRSCGVPPRR
jgi:hypothetical protein